MKRTSLFCATFVAYFFVLTSANAAVPVEESVDDSTGEVRQSVTDNRGNVVQPRSRPGQSPRNASTSLGIPPTIEPSVGGGGNETYPNREENYAGSQAGAGGANSGSTNQSQLGQLFYQIQILQQELQTMRGQLEDQEYLIKRLQKDQQDQYRDVDQRLLALRQNRPSPTPDDGSTVTDNGSSDAPVRTSAGGNNERQAYTDAFNAMRAREFEASLQGFKQLIIDYPNGQYTPNSYYWIGELHLAAQSNPEDARQAFIQVVNLYPDHQKAPDALYKLGVVYHNLGDTKSAITYLKQVQRDYPNTSAAGLAKKYASELE